MCSCSAAADAQGRCSVTKLLLSFRGTHSRLSVLIKVKSICRVFDSNEASSLVDSNMVTQIDNLVTVTFRTPRHLHTVTAVSTVGNNKDRQSVNVEQGNIAAKRFAGLRTSAVSLQCLTFCNRFVVSKSLQE